MNTNHKPATALPWNLGGSITGPSAAWRYSLTCGNEKLAAEARKTESMLCNPDKKFVATLYAKQDAAYIAHAANAYPQMVQVLKDRAALPEGGPERALLTKLGEA